MPRKADIDAIVATMPSAQYLQPTTTRESLAVVQECIASGQEAIILLKARTDTRYFHTALAAGAVVCFVKGRIRYPNQKSGSPLPSALVYFGPDARRFIEVFGKAGPVASARPGLLDVIAEGVLTVSPEEMAEWLEAVEARDWPTITQMVRKCIKTPEEKDFYSLGEWLEDVQDPDTALGESEPGAIAMVWDRIQNNPNITPSA